MRRSMCLAAGLALLAVPATAAEPEPSGSAVQITPYVWFAGFGGTFRGPQGPTFRVSQSFSDLLENLDAAFFVSGLARSGSFVAVADLSHTAGSRDGLVPTPIPGVPVVPAEGRLTQTSLTALGGVRAVDLPTISIDLLGGVRAFWLKTSVDAPAVGIDRSTRTDFASPVLAGRIDGRLGEGWSLLVYGDFGGFGLGSEFTSQAVATVNARVARRLWLSGGYRYLMVDRRDGPVSADVALGGPLLGATFTF